MQHGLSDLGVIRQLESFVISGSVPCCTVISIRAMFQRLYKIGNRYHMAVTEYGVEIDISQVNRTANLWLYSQVKME